MSRQTISNAKKPPLVNSTPVSAAANQQVAPRPAASVEAKPNIDAIRRRAYELYMERSKTGKPGNEVADWVQAEKELFGRK